MVSNIQFIQQTLMDFPWSYREQGTTLLALIDGILANRFTSWNGIVRWSFTDITVKKFWYLAHNSYYYLDRYLIQLIQLLIKLINEIHLYFGR
jgi:hypothetical protein